MQQTTLLYQEADQICEGYLAWHEDQKKPCVMVCHAWGGQSEYERARADRLAEQGYAAFALDVYGQGRRGHPTHGNEHLMQPFMDDRELLKRRLFAALETVRQHPGVDPDQIAVIGYCFGGLCALDLARSAHPAIKAAVSLHGAYVPPQLGEQAPITASVLVLHGHQDPVTGPAQLESLAEELTAAEADWQIYNYGHAMHAFTFAGAQSPETGIQYHPLAARRSERAMLDFLAEIFAMDEQQL